MDEDVYRRLAALPAADYNRNREAEVTKLGIRVATLGDEVARRWAPSGGVQGGQVDFHAIEPWPEAVDGAGLLDRVAATFTRYVALLAGAADAMALWTAHTHVFNAFVHTPRSSLCSPEEQCRKTLLLDVLAALVPRPLRTESITPAVLFRLVELHRPVLLLDEVDTYMISSDELWGSLNAGHKRGAKAYRCEGNSNEVRGFNAFAPAVLAGIGTLPGTLYDRSLIIRLMRAKPGDLLARFDSRHTAREQELC
jgi:putative DNA primase/helicase